MRPHLFAALAAYLVAAVHCVLAFINKRKLFESISLGALIFAFATHTTALIEDWVKEGRYPLFQLQETVSFLAWMLVVGYGIALYLYRTQALGVLMLPLVTVLTFYAAITPENRQRSISEITNGSGDWLFPLHTTIFVMAYASFFIAFAASIMYLLQERELKLKTFSAIFHRLPSLPTIDRLESTATGIGFTLLSLGIMTGMIWSSSRYGKLWHNDPKEIFALLTWLLYLALIYYRQRSAWPGRKAAWMGVLGFALVLCTFLGSRFMGSYHVFG
jgi:cytochrome c-type biogenesis protein CcsB